MIWMVSLRMFFVFKVEVLGGFKAWFQQSFWNSESWSPPALPWISPRSPQDLLLAFLRIPPALLRISLNSLGRFLFIGVWGWVSDTWQSWLVTHVTVWLVRLYHRLPALDRLCHRLHVLDYLCHRLHALMCDLVFAWHLANFCWFLSSDSKT